MCIISLLLSHSHTHFTIFAMQLIKLDMRIHMDEKLCENRFTISCAVRNNYGFY